MSFIKRIAKKIPELDIIGGSIDFTVKGSSKTYKTYLGALLSIVCFGVILWYTIITVLNILDRSTPNVLCNRESDIDRYSYQLYDSGVLPSINVYDKVNLTPRLLETLNKLVTVKADYWVSKYDYVLTKNIETTTPIELVPCLELKNKEPYAWIFSNPLYEKTAFTSVCLEVPKNMDLSIRGNRASFVDSRAVRIFVYPCSLANPSDCIQPTEFIKYSLLMFNIKKFVKYSDFNDPIKHYINVREELNLQVSNGNKYFNFVKQTVVKDNTNIFQPSHEDWKAIDIDREEINQIPRSGTISCTAQQVSDKTCESYFSVEFRSAGVQDNCSRTYSDVVDSISNIGGFKELLFMGMIILYSFYNDRFMNKYIISEFIHNDESLFSLGTNKQQSGQHSSNPKSSNNNININDGNNGLQASPTNILFMPPHQETR